MYFETEEPSPKKINPCEFAHTVERWYASGVISEAMRESFLRFAMTLEIIAEVKDYLNRFDKFDQKLDDKLSRHR